MPGSNEEPRLGIMDPGCTSSQRNGPSNVGAATVPQVSAGWGGWDLVRFPFCHPSPIQAPGLLLGLIPPTLPTGPHDYLEPARASTMPLGSDGTWACNMERNGNHSLDLCPLLVCKRITPVWSWKALQGPLRRSGFTDEEAQANWWPGYHGKTDRTVGRRGAKGCNAGRLCLFTRLFRNHQMLYLTLSYSGQQPAHQT